MSGDESKELSLYRAQQAALSTEAESRPPRGQNSECDEDEINLREYWRVIYKRRKVIFGVFLGIVSLTASVVIMMTPRYTATATVQIDRQSPKVAPVQEVQQLEAAVLDKYDYYETQYHILEGRELAARVIKALALDTDARFTGDGPGPIGSAVKVLRSLLHPKGGETAPDELGMNPDLIDQYLDMLAIDPVRNSRLVEVGFTSKSPELSALVSNRHVEEYINQSLDQRVTLTQKAKEFLEAELAKAKDRVDTAEVALNAFRREKGVISLEGDKSDIVSERLDDLNRRFTEAQGDRIRLEGQYQLIQRRAYESLPEVVGSLMISELKQEASKIEAERARLEEKFNPTYPKLAQILASENQVKSRLNAEIAKIVQSIESAYLAARSREDELGRQLEAQRQIALSQKDVSAAYNTLKRDVDTVRDLYANLLQRLKDVDVAEEITVSNVLVVGRAATPVRPSRPRKLLSLAAAATVGLLMGVALAFLLEHLDNTVRTPEDVEHRIGLPMLGIVPGFDTPGSAYGAAKGNGLALTHASNGSGSKELVVAKHPRSVVAEAYRAIRTGILLSSADNPPRLILFTSSLASEGKTVTAINQAITLAQSGARVLIIDADIRKPRLHTIFGVPNGHGLSTYLTGQSPLQSVIHKASLGSNGNGHWKAAAADDAGESAAGETGLFVLPSGPIPPNPAELLGSRRMLRTLEQLREHYDYILVDSPPVLPVTDAVVLAPIVDGVVLVVRGQQTPIDIVTKCRDRLEYARAKIVGVILNDVDVTSGDYEQYHRYYYSYYGNQTTVEEETPGPGLG